MLIKKEDSLSNFEFWQGAADRVKYLTQSELDIIEEQLTELYPDGIDETQLNDIFWFDFEFIAEMIGETEDSILERGTKMKLSIDNLQQTLRAGGPCGDRDDASDLIFRVDGKRYIIRDAKIHLPDSAAPDSQSYEDYWDEAANVDRAIAEAKEVVEL